VTSVAPKGPEGRRPNLKILQVLGWYHPENLGGTEVYVSALSKRLVSQGHEVLIAAPRPGAKVEDSYEHDGLSVYRYPTPSRPTRSEAQGVGIIRGGERFHRRMREFRPDVVHFHNLVTGIGLTELRAAKDTGAKVILTSHASRLGFICQRGTLMQWGEFPCDGLLEIMKCGACELQNRGLSKQAATFISRTPVRLSRLLGRSETRIGTAAGMPDLISRNRQMHSEMLALVEHFVVLTSWAARIVELNGIPPGKLVVNRLGISQTDTIRKPPPAAKPTMRPVTIGYLGRFERVKGVHALAAAIERLPRSLDCNFEFRGPLLTDAERAIHDELEARLAKDRRVRFEPAARSTEVAEVLASYDVLCCPSECAEGGPTVALEAHSVGTPVIGSRIGGLAEIVSDRMNGRLFEAGDVAALTDVLEELATSPEQTIDAWRENLPATRTMDDVTRDYLRLY
jgi:glycosyltransferase involved in cell wall biosynthesis